jgi:hypothetical protein
MSYQVYDENGYVGDFATTKGYEDFVNWCNGLQEEEIQDFITDGMSIHPLVLHEVLADYDPPLGDIKKTYDNFLKLLLECSGIVIVSDGLNDDLEDLEEE